MTALIIILVVAVIIAVKSLMVVPENQRYVIERLGKFRSVAGPGLVVVLPLLDRVAGRFPLDVQEVRVPHDGRNVVIRYRVIDPQKARYGVSDFITALHQAARTAIDSTSGRGTDVFARKALAEKIDGIVENFGLKVTEVEVK